MATDKLDGFHPTIRSAIVQSELDGGVYLKDIPVGGSVHIQTRNTRYVVKKISDTDFTISGNNHYCPEPTKAHIAGSTWGGSMLRMGFIGRGMHLEFSIDSEKRITTTAILEIAESDEALDALLART